jgi:toxin ParE1/3/4
VARTVSWTESALADVESTAVYIARDSVYFAKAVARDAFDASRLLDTFSERGRVVPEVNDTSIRELIIRGTYRLVYQITDDRVYIIGFIHGARDLSARWLHERRSLIGG